MFGVCFPYPDLKVERTHWAFAFCHWKPDHIWVIGDKLPGEKVFKDAICINSADDLPTDPKLVVMAPPSSIPRREPDKHIVGTISLHTFKHPKDAIYIIGANRGLLSKNELGSRNGDYYVYVPTSTTDEICSWMVAGVILYDRISKEERG